MKLPVRERRNLRWKVTVMQIAKSVTLQFLRAYKWLVSPLLPPSCRYVPSCSEYAMEAVERYGTLRGSWMAMMAWLKPT